MELRALGYSISKTARGNWNWDYRLPISQAKTLINQALLWLPTVLYGYPTNAEVTTKVQWFMG